MEFAAWDLECSNLDADFGLILCSGLKPLGKKVEIIRIDQFPKYKTDRIDYSGLLEEVRDRFNKLDGIITWYGNRFDLPFLRSGYILYGMTPHKPLFHIDLWYTARYKFKLHSNRLASYIDYLEVSKKKTPLQGVQWKRAIAGDTAALDYIVKHCRKDVESLEQVYRRVKDFVNRVERRP